MKELMFEGVVNIQYTAGCWREGSVLGRPRCILDGLMSASRHGATHSVKLRFRALTARPSK